MSGDGNSSLLVVLQRLEAGQERIGGEVTRLSGEVTRLSGEVTRLSGEVTRQGGALDRLRVDLMARMDRLQNTLKTQEEASVVNFGGVERAERIAMSAREEVRIMGEQVNAMVHQIRQLQAEVRELRGGA